MTAILGRAGRGSAVRAPATGTAASLGDASTPGRDPIIVLVYSHAGGAELHKMLSAHPALACTQGTNVLMACEQAAEAWRRIDGRPGSLSQLGRGSVRHLGATMITVITAQAGRPVWCEMVTPELSALDVFLTVFPGTRFVCLHRAFPDLAAAAIAAMPWGLSGATYAPYVSAYPGNPIAAQAAWWCAHARRYVEFEEAHPGSCVRLRFEDLNAHPRQALGGLLDSLGLDPLPPILADPPAENSAANLAAGPGGQSPRLPFERIPDPQRELLDELHKRLGYPPIGRN